MNKFYKILILVLVLVGISTGAFFYGKSLNKPVEQEQSKIEEFDRYGTSKHSEVTRDNYRTVLNEYRLEQELPMFIDDDNLEKYAQARAEEIHSGKVKLGHETLLGGYGKYTGDYKKFKSVSELSQGWYNNTYLAVDKFKASPTHNASLTNTKFTHLGIGISGGVIVLQLGELN